MDYDSKTKTWAHLDFDSSSDAVAASFAIVGDFYGEKRDVLVVAPATRIPSQNPTTLWVREFSTSTRSWTQGAFVCDATQNPWPQVKLAIAGDFDGDGIKEIAVAQQATGSAKNHFWIMKAVGRQWQQVSHFDCDDQSSDTIGTAVVAGDFDGD